MEILIFLGVFVSVSLVAIFVMQLLSRSVNPDRHRLSNIMVENNIHEKTIIDTESILKAQNEVSPKLQKLMDSLNIVASKNPKTIKRKSQLLVQAGHTTENAYKIYASIKVAASMIFFVLGIYTFMLLGHPPAKIIMLSFLVAIVGYIVPDYYLIIKSRKRQSSIGNALPDALDLLVVTVEAGLSLNAAIMKVGEEIAVRSKALSEEFLLVYQDMRTGNSREQALRDLAVRNNIEDLRIFVGALVIADKLGTSVAQTLRAQGDSLRTRVRQRAEERAAKASLKMLFPLVLFILPTLFIVLLGPGAISVIELLGPGAH